jgi:curved DNA-binding protein CbpA
MNRSIGKMQSAPTPNIGPIVSTLKRLVASSECGELLCTNKEGSRCFFINAGCIACFTSTRREDDLALFLFKNQLITQIEYDVLASRAPKENDLVTLILNSEIIEKNTLLQQQQARALDALIESALSSSDHSSFHPSSPELHGGLGMGLSLRQVLLEMARRQINLGEVDVIVRLGGEDVSLRCAEIALPLLQGLSLTPQESFVLSRMNIPSSFRQLQGLVPFPLPDLLRILGALVNAGLVVSEAPSVHQSSERLENLLPSAAQRDPDPSASVKDELREQQRFRAESLLDELQDASPFQILGVPETATKADIKAAYHRLAKEFHPDRFFGETAKADTSQRVRELFEKIRSAYESLKDDAPRNEQSGKQQTPKDAGPSPEELEKTARASHNLGVQNYQQKDFFSAVQHFREAVRLQPESARYRHSLARALMRNPRWRREAEEQFLKAIELDEFNADYRVSLGMLYLEGGLPRKAEAQFRDALTWDAENRAAHRELGKMQSKSQTSSWFEKILGRKKT